MENKFGTILKKETVEDGEYINFSFWQIGLIIGAIVLIIVNASISGQGVIVWIVNFLLQLAIFTVVAAILATLFNLSFKRGWAAVFAVVIILGALFGLYDAIRGYNYRKDMEVAYQKQLLEQQQKQAAAQQQQQQQSESSKPATPAPAIVK